MQSSYWSKVLERRVGRRRAISATAATAGAAAFLVACGSDDDDEPSTTGGSTGATGGTTGSTGSTGGSTGSTGGATGSTGGSTGAASELLAPRVNTRANAKPGGRFAHATNREPSHFDGKAQGQVQLNTFNQLAYEALVSNKPGEGTASTWTEVVPELAESWEVSPDNLTITFKIRQGVKWQNRAPISGRAFDAEDVAATWARYEGAQTPNNKFTNSNNLNPAAPIVSMTAIDPQTLEIKLARPATYLFQRLSTMITGELGSIYPREAGDTFDPEKDQIGTGPWMLDHFTPSVELLYKVNPDYWGDKNLFEELHFPVIPEYATRLAQFRTGALSTAVVTPEDMVPTKNDVKGLSMYQLTLATNSTGNVMRFGWLPINGKPSPFFDIRLRQALHYAVNRDEFIEAFANVSAFEAAGVPVNTYYYTTQGYVPELTMDPRDSSFGENAELYSYNMEEAKKLFDAAQSAYGGSYPEIKSHAVATVFGPNYTAESEAMDGYARELGLNIVNEQLDYNTGYLPNFVTKQGQFEGILYGIGAVTSGDMTDYYLWRYYSKTGATSGQLGYGGPDGSLGDNSGDAEVDALIEKATEEFDAEARIEIFHQLQRYLTGQAYMVPRGGFADTFALAWPAISNFAFYQNDSRVNLDANLPFNPMSMWFDESQPHG